MYGAIRDLICEFLGYPRPSVLIDTAGQGGRPDITVRAPSGIEDSIGRSVMIDWIVLEAKDERNAFSDTEHREDIFSKKAKYITADTAWFVMVDPVIIVARPVGTIMSLAGDLVLHLDGSETEAKFSSTFSRMSYNTAGVPERLKAFREGDQREIASEKLTAPSGATKRVINQVQLARRNFYSTLRQTTQILQEATFGALDSVRPTLDDIKKNADEFGVKYNGFEFRAYPLSIKGYPKSLEAGRTHDRDASRLRRLLAKNPVFSRLALCGLVEFEERTGATDAQTRDKMFATETANLVLARILLIRFLEDHGFFGKRRYICNGGVEAFQHIKTYFGYGYTKLLEDAYRNARRLYAAAFDETELDWIFATDNPHLSQAIEWAMYQFSRYDFTTVKGDILTGIYDRFLDKRQRKSFGEYYTPPSVARYILDRLDLPPHAKIIDPACGSGTFLIERYQQAIGEDAERGLATYDDAIAAIERISGNDINTFSAVLAQIQL